MILLKKIIKFSFLIIVVFFLCIAFHSTRWALNTFAFLDFDQVLFQLTSPIESASSEILSSYISNALVPSVFLSILIFILIFAIISLLKCKKIKFYFRFKNKIVNKTFSVKIIKKVVVLFSIFLFLGIIIMCFYKIKFIDYVIYQFNDSKFIKNNYINPRKTEIKFPDNKRNLIYIYAESLESTFFSKELGGESSQNYMEPLTELTKENINFSDTKLFGGAIGVPGTTWTTAGMVSQTSGLPLKLESSLFTNTQFSSILKGANTIGDILYDNGYNNMLMLGSYKAFGNRGTYFKKHGNYNIFDYETAVKKRKIDKDYFTWWGFEDSKLFEYSKEEIIELSKQDKPFNFTLLTTNTHSEDGYIEDDCDVDIDSKYGKAIYCSTKQIVEFIDWIKQQDFYDNTTIVIVGDHISMQSNIYPDSAKRRIYNLFINSAKTTDNVYNRKFSTMDMFPTTLSSLGVNIKGNKLGLGTDLFSSRKTLIEKIGEKKFSYEISSYSSYYMKKFVY